MQKILISEIKVKNELEAIELAHRLKKSGEYDIFRGQKVCWPLNSTLSRIDTKERELAYERLNNFASWIHSNPELDELITNKDKILTVAQHYGIATSFIDFTSDPEVALFFATTNVTKISEEACIYCASKKALVRSFLDFKKVLDKVDMRLLELEVGNLWRLQSQKGLFLDVPLAGLPYWEDFFPFHKIIFPHTKKYKSKIPIEVIYPKRKSRLEIKLDQYFREEDVINGLDRAEKMGIKVTLTPWESDYFLFFDGQKPAIDSDWEKVENEKWASHSVEPYVEAVISEFSQIQINEEIKSFEEIQDAFSKSLSNLIYADLKIKSHAIKLKIEFLSGENNWTDEMTKALELFWDGSRQFPYSNEEICNGFGNLAAMLYSSTLNSKDYVSDIFGEVLSFDCLIKNAGHFRVPLPTGPLKKALKADLLSQIDSNLFPNIKSTLDLIDYVHDITVLFEFESFKTFLITYFIPCQIIANLDPTSYYSGQPKEHLLIVFSPFEITSIRSALDYLRSAEKYRFKKKVVAIHPSLNDQELIILMSDALKNINKGSRPITITISGFETDRRELYQIPEVAQFCKRLLDLGFVSIQEVATTFRTIPESYDPYALGAFEVWQIANNKMKKTMEYSEVGEHFETFYNELSKYNEQCDKLIAGLKIELDEKIIEDVKAKGMFGSDVVAHIAKTKNNTKKRK
jgi:hypothetical protein